MVDRIEISLKKNSFNIKVYTHFCNKNFRSGSCGRIWFPRNLYVWVTEH